MNSATVSLLDSPSVDRHSLTATQCDIGDSFGSQCHYTDLQRMRRGLENWLGTAFRVPFKDLGGTLPIGRQEDGYSCGVCVINAVEHAMFGVPLFTDKDRHALRVQYFVDAVKYLLENVRILFCIRSDCADPFF